jgi:Bacterial protein of unknown function (DUF882)
MPGNLSFAMSFSLACLFVPSAVLAKSESAAPRSSKAHDAHPAGGACTKAPIEVVAGSESATLSLSTCNGGSLPASVDELSVLARPGSAPKPAHLTAAGHKGGEVAPGIHRLDDRLVERLQAAVDHFAKPGEESRVTLISGVRPRGSGSYHSSGRAIDFRVEGTSNESLMAFCKTLPDTGCGYYPNDVFVHMDVRDRGAGHVAWSDAKQASGTPGAPAVTVNAPAPITTATPAKPALSERAEAPPLAPAAEARGSGTLGLSLAVPVATPAVEEKPAAEASAKLPPLPAADHAAAAPAVHRHGRSHARRRHADHRL